MVKILQDTQKGGEGKRETDWLGLAQAIGCVFKTQQECTPSTLSLLEASQHSLSNRRYLE